jgi:hypothetical protein
MVMVMVPVAAGESSRPGRFARHQAAALDTRGRR